MPGHWTGRGFAVAVGIAGLLVLLAAPGHAQGIADLAVDKTVDKTEAVVGEHVTYTVVVSNNGPDGAPSG